MTVEEILSGVKQRLERGPRRKRPKHHDELYYVDRSAIDEFEQEEEEDERES